MSLHLWSVKVGEVMGENHVWLCEALGYVVTVYGGHRHFQTPVVCLVKCSRHSG